MTDLPHSTWKSSAASRRRYQRIESARARHTEQINALRRKLRNASLSEFATQFSIWQELRSHPDNHQPGGAVSPEEHRAMIEFLFRDELARRGLRP